MKVELKTDPNIKEPFAVITTPEITKEIFEVKEFLEAKADKRITVYSEGENYLIEPDDIYYFFTEGKKIFCKTESEFFEVKYKIFEIEEKFCYFKFVKLSQGVVANISKIKNIKVLFNGTMEVRFVNGDMQYASRRSVSEIKRRLGV